MASPTPTKAAELQLRDELQVIRQGYEFLDEKRMLLAGELLRQLAELQALETAFGVQRQAAAAALQLAVERHGLDGLSLQPPAPLEPARPELTPRRFLGVAVPQAELRPRPTPPAYPPADPSLETEACREAFRRLLFHAVKLGCAAGNLSRLSAAFRQTEQRARALENVLLPEVHADLRAIADQLELAEQEEIIRVRLASRGRT